jgi:hypothetical protein
MEARTARSPLRFPRATALALAAAALTLACGGGRKDDTGPIDVARSAGCPAPLVVRIAMVETVAGEAHWLLQEGVVPEEQARPLVGEADTSSGDVVVDLTPEDAKHLGATSSDEPVWLFVGDDVPPCQARARGWVAVHGGDGPTHTRVARVIDGCRPQKGQPSVVFALQARDAAGCRFREPRLLSQRSEGNGAVSLPGEIAGFVPAPASPCDAPACDARWLVKVNDFPGGTNFYEATVSWVYPVEDVSECEWKVDDYFGHFYRVETNAPVERWAAQGGHAGAFYDEGGVRAAVHEEPGRYWVYTPGDPLPALAQDVTWYLAHEEDFMPRSLGPYCGP